MGHQRWCVFSTPALAMDFKPVVAESLSIMAPPTDEQLTLLRLEIDPESRVVALGKWITYKSEK